jgi:hypothetical protein
MQPETDVDKEQNNGDVLDEKFIVEVCVVLYFCDINHICVTTFDVENKHPNISISNLLFFVLFRY